MEEHKQHDPRFQPMVVEDDDGDERMERRELKFVADLFSIFRRLHDQLARLEEAEGVEEEEQRHRRSYLWGVSRNQHHARLRQGVRDASRGIVNMVFGWRGKNVEEGELVRVMGIIWQLLEVFFFKGSMSGMLPPWPTVEWLQNFAEEEQPMTVWEHAMDLVLLGKLQDAWATLEDGGAVHHGHQVWRQIHHLLQSDPWAAAAELVRREEEEGVLADDQSVAAARKTLLDNWARWHNEALQLVKQAENQPPKIQNMVAVLAGDVGVATSMIHQQHNPQWTKLLLVKILYKSPEVYLNRSSFNDHRKECQQSLRGLQRAHDFEDSSDNLLDSLIDWVGQGRVGHVLQSMWEHSRGSLVTVSLLTFLADLVCVAWRAKGILDEMAINVDGDSQSRLRAKALLHLANEMINQGLTTRVKVTLAPAVAQEGGERGQWERVPLWRMAFELLKVAAVGEEGDEALKQMIKLVSSLPGEHLSQGEVEWLREQCVDVLRVMELLEAFAHMCCSSGKRALDHGSLALGINFLLRSASTLSQLDPPRSMDLPLGPLGEPLQCLRLKASRVADTFLDELYKALQPQAPGNPVLKSIADDVKCFTAAVRDFESVVERGSTIICLCPELALMEDLKDTLSVFVENRILEATHRLVSILSRRRDPSSIQRFWARILKVLLAFLALIRQEGREAPLLPNQAFVALQCLETLETSHRRDEYLRGVMDEGQLRQLRYELAKMIAKAFRIDKSAKEGEVKAQEKQHQPHPASQETTSSFWSPCQFLVAPRMWE